MTTDQVEDFEIEAPATIRPPPDWIENVTCYHPGLVNDPDFLSSKKLTSQEILRFFLLILNSGLTIVFHSMFLKVINHRDFSWIKFQPKLIFWSLSICHTSTEVTVLVFGLYPSLFNCWPFGKTSCRIQVSTEVEEIKTGR